MNSCVTNFRSALINHSAIFAGTFSIWMVNSVKESQKTLNSPHIAFIVRQALFYEAAQNNTSKMLQQSTTEEQIRYTSTSMDLPKLSARPTKPNMN
jgi:hypothetical protein